MNATKIVSLIEKIEVDGNIAPDCRNVMRDERFHILSAMRSGTPAAIAEAVKEAKRVGQMWKVM